MQLNMAILGFGKSAKRYHLPYLLNQSILNVKYIYVLDRDEAAEKKYSTKSIDFVTDLDIILKDPDIHLVSVCTPPETHYSFGKKILEHGKHVILEKPFCETVTQATELQQLALERNLMITPYQNRRFDSDFLTLKWIIEKEYVGQPIELESRIDYFRPSIQEKKGPIIGGALYSMGIHMIDQMVSLFGKPEFVTYDLRNVQYPKNPTEDYFDVGLFYPPLKVTLKSSPLVAMSNPRFVLHGTKGTYIKFGIDQQETDLKKNVLPGEKYFGEDTPDQYGKVKYVLDSGEWIEKTIISRAGNYGNFYHSVRDTILNKKEKIVTDEQSITVLQILEEGFKK